jgi:hypothetical protein
MRRIEARPEPASIPLTFDIGPRRLLVALASGAARTAAIALAAAVACTSAAIALATTAALTA